LLFHPASHSPLNALDLRGDSHVSPSSIESKRLLAPRRALFSCDQQGLTARPRRLSARQFWVNVIYFAFRAHCARIYPALLEASKSAAWRCHMAACS
jgi:hypothetical protein